MVEGGTEVHPGVALGGAYAGSRERAGVAVSPLLPIAAAGEAGKAAEGVAKALLTAAQTPLLKQTRVREYEDENGDQVVQERSISIPAWVPVIGGIALGAFLLRGLRTGMVGVDESSVLVGYKVVSGQNVPNIGKIVQDPGNAPYGGITEAMYKVRRRFSLRSNGPQGYQPLIQGRLIG